VWSWCSRSLDILLFVTAKQEDSSIGTGTSVTRPITREGKAPPRNFFTPPWKNVLDIV